MARMPAGATDARWTLGDVVDFETLAEAASRRVDDGHDRRLLAGVLSPFPGTGTSGTKDAAAERRRVFLAWTAAMRTQDDAPPLAGTALDHALQAVRWLAVMLGLLTGAGLAGALLVDAAVGTAEPVNALRFLGATTGLQLALLCLAGVAVLARRAGWRAAPVRRLAWGMVEAASRLFQRAAPAQRPAMSGERREALRASAATFRRRSGAHAGLMACEALRITQGFAIAFNIGILGAMLFFYLPFVDLRFGWQSTYRIGADAVHHGVQWVAAPWAGFAPHWQPTAPQVVASQYTRGQPAVSLPANAARAWWPFLLAALTCYGLLPRLALALAASLALRRGLAGLRFDHPAANALWRRLHGPLIAATDGAGATLPDGSARAASGGVGSPSHPVLVASDELPPGDAAAHRETVRARLGWCDARWLTAVLDDDRLAPDMRQVLSDRAIDAIAVLAPARQDPIVAVAGFLRAVAAAAPAGAERVVVLIGAATASDGADRLAIWRRFVAIQRLDFGVEPA